MMKLIQFLSPSRPVVVYCQFHEASTRREGGRDIPYGDVCIHYVLRLEALLLIHIHTCIATRLYNHTYLSLSLLCVYVILF